MQRQAHGDPHPEHLRQLQAPPAVVDEIAVVEGLQAEVLEGEIPLRREGRAQPLQVEVEHLGRQQLQLDRAPHVLGEGQGIGGAGLVDTDPPSQRLGVETAQQRPRGDERVGRVAFDARPRRQHDRALQIGQRRAGGETGQHLFGDRLGRDAVLVAGAGLGDPGAQQRQVEQHLLAVGVAQPQRLLLATPGARLAVEDVAAGDGEGPGRHQRPLHLVLDRFDGGDDLPFIDHRQRGEDRGRRWRRPGRRSLRRWDRGRGYPARRGPPSRPHGRCASDRRERRAHPACGPVSP